MKKGDKISKNFELHEQINDINSLIFELQNKPSIFWNFRINSTSFFIGWPLRTIIDSLNKGCFWSVKKINQTKFNGGDQTQK